MSQKTHKNRKDFKFFEKTVGSLLQCSAARLSVCHVVLQIPQARHIRLVADIFVKMSRGCYENATRKLIP